MQKWKVGGVDLMLPYMFGAGVCKTPESTAQWIEVAPVVSGSYTLNRRLGNSGKVLHPDTLEQFLEMGCGYNYYGMPNEGGPNASNKLALMDFDYSLIASVAGFSLKQFIALAKIFEKNENVNAVEFNIGCPNSESEIFSFNSKFVLKLLQALVQGKFSKPSWIKFSPFSNPSDIKRMALLLNEFRDVLQLAVVTCNTMPNCYAGKGNIDSVGGKAGMSGKALMSKSIGSILDWKEHLKDSIDVIGVGGITVADDILDFLDSGASVVQVTSVAHWAGNPSAFNDHFFSEQNASRFFDFMKDNI